MKAKLLTLASVLAISFAANASVTYDEEGVGFVGKGDVQSLFGWNNHDLQANAEFIQFRMVMPGGVASWKCEGINPGNNLVMHTKGPVAVEMNSDVSVDARKNRNGQVTGFLLNGFDENSAPDYASIGECTAPNSNWKSYYLVPGSLVYEGEDDGAEMMLQVTVDGETWYDMPITD